MHRCLAVGRWCVGVLALTICSLAHSQNYLVDTGPGGALDEGGVGLDAEQYLAVRFSTVENPQRIGIAQIWGYVDRFADIDIVIYPNGDGDVPEEGGELIRRTFVPSGQGWIGTCLNIDLEPGDYWLAFEPIGFEGGVPDNAPLSIEAGFYNVNNEAGWYEAPGESNWAARIATDPCVFEVTPAAIPSLSGWAAGVVVVGLLGIGLTGLRKRRLGPE